MSDRKDKKIKSVGEDTARKIWLAGIGAYGRAFSEAQDSLSKLTKSSTKVFDDLVQKGEVIETMVTIKGKDMASDVAEKVGGGFDIDERINKMRSRLKYAERGVSDNVEERLDVIEAKLDAVIELLSVKKVAPKKTPAKKPIAKKRTVTKTAVKKAKK